MTTVDHGVQRSQSIQKNLCGPMEWTDRRHRIDSGRRVDRYRFGAGRSVLETGRPAPFLFVFFDQGFFGFFVLFLGNGAFLVSLIQIDQLLTQGLGAYRHRHW